MASRKVKAKRPTRANRIDQSELTLTREVDALTVAQLAARARPDSPAPMHVGGRVIDDLAQTIEGPTASRVVIMDAAETLIGHVGFAMLTATQVASVAGLGVDVFHAHFANTHALLEALTQRFVAQAVDVAIDAARPKNRRTASPRERVEQATRAATLAILRRAALVRAVLASGDAELVVELRKIGEQVASVLHRTIAETESDKLDLEDIAFVVLLALSLAFDRMTIGSTLAMDRDDLLERSALAVGAYLDARRPSRARGRNSERR